MSRTRVTAPSVSAFTTMLLELLGLVEAAERLHRLLEARPATWPAAG